MRIGDTVAARPRHARSPRRRRRNRAGPWQSQAHGPPRRQADPRHRRPHRRLARVRRGPPRAGAGRRGDPHRRRAWPVAHAAHRPQAAAAEPTCWSSTSPTRPGRRGARRARPRAGTASTARCTPSGSRPRRASAAASSDAPWEDVAVALQISAYSLKTLADVVVPHMSGGGSIVGPRLRQQHAGLAGLRLDGRGQGRAREHQPLPRPRPRAAGHPREPGRGRPDQDAGGQVDPRLPALRGRVGRAQPAGLGREGRRRRRGPVVRGAAVGLVPEDHRRDRPRRRRLPQRAPS